MGRQKTLKYHCRCISSCCCGVATKYGKLERRLFFCFYGLPVQSLQSFTFCPYSTDKQDQKMRCGFCFNEDGVFYRVLSWCFEIIKKKHGPLFLLSLHRGFIFDHVTLSSPTLPRLAEDTSNNHYHAFPWRNSA